MAAAARTRDLPEYVALDVVAAICVLIRFGGIDQATADLPRLAEASRRLGRDRYWTDVAQDVMLAALPGLIERAYEFERAIDVDLAATE